MERAEVIETLYRALHEHDGETMAGLYHPEAHFSDPVFPELRGEEVGMMWRMLCERGKDLRVEASGIAVDGERGKAHWEAYYTFSATGRSVHNIIDASFVFDGDQIVEHRDVFSLWRWSRQALGPMGLVLGWSPVVRGKIQSQARKGLEMFIKARRASPG